MTSIFAQGAETSIYLGIRTKKPQYEYENVSVVVEGDHY